MKFIFENLEVKTREIPFSYDDAYRQLNSKVGVTKSIPVLLTKKYSDSDKTPYFNGIVDAQKNNIELLYNPRTNKFVRISATIVVQNEQRSTLIYRIYPGGEMMFYLKLIFMLQLGIMVLAWPGLLPNSSATYLLFGAICFMVIARIIETQKILFDKAISTSLKMQQFLNLGILSFGVLLVALIIAMSQSGKVQWQLPIVLLFFFVALRFLRNIGGTKHEEDKFLEIFK